MSLKTLYLRNFRNYEETEVHFSPHINVIWGNNAQGKTNLLEAIHLIATGRSFRSQHLAELIRERESFFYLEAEILQNHTVQSIKISFDGQNKRLQLGATSYTSFNPLLGILPLILYAPSDLELIGGSPALRRRFLNLHLAQSDPLYVHHLTRFWRAMKQRNCLLRRGRSPNGTERGIEPIDCWESEMALSSAYLHHKRHSLIEELKIPLIQRCKTLSQTEEIHELRYHPSLSQDYPSLLEKNRKREQELGFTLVGPHRDELSFWIGGRLAKPFASEGQKKTAIASLRLAEWDHLAKLLEGTPLMAIDDLGAPLDETRQLYFHKSLETLGQVFITTPTASLNFEQQNKIHIENGRMV
ncbi:MAG: DNA replication/repair protein RecF [Chlamydiia bacterium]|nr:DNA replication/repair protein RecF [Chlamydiia bacterium]